jgi:hypothetical protein
MSGIGQTSCCYGVEVPPLFCQDHPQMTSTKSSNPKPRPSPRITCYGTAFLTPIDAILLMHGIAAEVPQFSSPRLDASFLINCGRLQAARLHAGRFPTRNATTMEAPSAYVKRVAGSDFLSPKGTVIYECSTELHELLAALTPERVAEMATEWYGAYAPPKAKSAKLDGRRQTRLAIIKNLVALAQRGKERQMILMLRVDYRKQR